MIFRRAIPSDGEAIGAIYNRIHDEEEAGRTSIGWNRTIYPTYASAMESIGKGEMFVAEVQGAIVAAAKLNGEQVYPAYEEAQWMYEAADDEVFVIHTLVVDPLEAGKGYGRAFVKFYEEYADKEGYRVLRLDTNEKNLAARRLYQSMGYREASIVPCIFNGIPSVNLVCLEKPVMEQE